MIIHGRLLISMINNIRGQFSGYEDLKDNRRMTNTMVTIVFESSYATPIIRILIRVISELKVNISDCNYISDLDKIFCTKQLKDVEYNGDNYFSNFCCHTHN